jgi:hypothetical protein
MRTTLVAFLVCSAVGQANADITKRWTLEPGKVEQGTEPSTAAQRKAQTEGCPEDHAGHIMAKRMGGSGTDLANIFPQHPSLNTGAFETWESDIMKKLAETGSDGAFKYKQIDFEVTLRLGDTERPLRPWAIKYCYTATASNGAREAQRCKEFTNLRPNNCVGEKNPDLQQLLAQVSIHKKDSLEARKAWRETGLRYVDSVCKLDIERANDTQWSEEDRAFDRGLAKLVVDQRNDLYELHKAHWRSLTTYLNGATKLKAQAAIDALQEDMALVDRTLATLIKSEINPEREKRKRGLVTLHEEQQSRIRCEASSDGSDDADCRDDDTCTVFEFGPEGTNERSRLQGLADRNARRANDTLKNSSDSRIKRCFDKSGPTRGAGYKAQLQLYRSCK